MGAAIVPASAQSGRVRPFPWGTVASMGRDHARLSGAFSRFAASRGGGSGVLAALSEIVRGQVAVSIRRVQSARDVEPFSGSVAFLAEEAGAAWRGVVEVERALALSVVARALGRPAPRLAAPDAPIAPAVFGAFAAVATAALRRATGDHVLRVLSAGDGAAVWNAALRYHDDLVVTELHAWLDDDAFLVRVALPRETLVAAPDLPMSTDALADMGDVRLTMPVVACVSAVGPDEIASLGIGDVLMPGSFALASGGAGTLSGRVWLAAPRSDRGIAADLGEGGKVVVGGDYEDLAMGNVAVENAGELPVVVRVEIGSVELRAREWAALKSGDVVALGQRIGSPVVLRVGTSEVARGELVEIDGEVGVRILSRGDAR